MTEAYLIGQIGFFVQLATWRQWRGYISASRRGCCRSSGGARKVTHVCRREGMRKDRGTVGRLETMIVERTADPP